MKEYIVTLCAASLLVAVSNSLLSDGSVKKYSLLAGSLAVSLVIAMPFARLIMGELEIELPQTEGFEVTYDVTEYYTKALGEEYALRIEAELGCFGRVMAKVRDDLTVESIEIYTEVPLSDAEREKIIEDYSPERLEVHFEAD